MYSTHVALSNEKFKLRLLKKRHDNSYSSIEHDCFIFSCKQFRILWVIRFRRSMFPDRTYLKFSQHFRSLIARKYLTPCAGNWFADHNERPNRIQ